MLYVSYISIGKKDEHHRRCPLRVRLGARLWGSRDGHGPQAYVVRRKYEQLLTWAWALRKALGRALSHHQVHAPKAQAQVKKTPKDDEVRRAVASEQN